MGAIGTAVAAVATVAVGAAAAWASSGSSYSPSKVTTASHAEKVAEELAEMKEEMGEASGAMEQELMTYAEINLEAFMKALEGINHQTYGGKQLDLNLSALREKNKKIKDKISGAISKVVDGRLVLTDNELSEILKEEDDKKRGKDFRNFVVKVQKQALNQLKKEFDKVIEEQSQAIHRTIEQRIQEMDRNMQASMREYEKLVEQKRNNDEKLKHTEMEYMYRFELASLVRDVVEE